MPLSGGPANKFGNRYELWWTVSQLIRILDGEAESVRIEAPTADKAEFVLIAGGPQRASSGKTQPWGWQMELGLSPKRRPAPGDVRSAFQRSRRTIRFCLGQ